MSSLRSVGGVSGGKRAALPRWLASLLLALAAFWLLAACSSSAVAPGDPAGIRSASGSHLVGIVVAAGPDGVPTASITQADLDAAQSAEPFAAKLADLVDENRLGINFTWLLVAGFLVMFMQAGFALVETGFTRAKNAMHTMSMNFMIYGIGIVGYFLVGFGFAFGGIPGGAVGGGNLGTTAALGSSLGFDGLGTHLVNGLAVTNHWTFLGTTGFALNGAAYDVSVVAFFLFQLVFMDTTATIPTGSMAERWRWKPFIVYGLFVSMILYPFYEAWTWGGGFLTQLSQLGLGAGYADFAGSGVVHSIGGWCALAGAMVIGPRIGKYVNGKTNIIPGHNTVLALLGTFILAFGWFGFNPGSTFGASGNGALRIGIVAVTTMLASGFGACVAMLYTMKTEGKPNTGMMANGMLAGLVAITAPSGFVGPLAAAIIGSIAGVLVCLSVAFFDKLKIDDPVGAISVHGVNGLWGVLSVGIFADGTSNYAGYAVKGILYGDAGQLVAQVIGGAVAFGWGFGGSYVFFKVLNKIMPLRVSAEIEIGGLDIPEMGMAGYVPDDMPMPAMA